MIPRSLFPFEGNPLTTRLFFPPLGVVLGGFCWGQVPEGAPLVLKNALIFFFLCSQTSFCVLLLFFKALSSFSSRKECEAALVGSPLTLKIFSLF